jgi:hypothetical protein
MPQRASTKRIELKPTQERVLAVLAEQGSGRITRGRYEEIAGVSRSQAAYDLAELVDAGLLERIGGGRATGYRLVPRDRPRQRHWTEERIRSSLTDFCLGRGAWPSASEFKAAGRSDLYVAASRYGGIGFWATELGFPRPERAAPPRAPLRSWRPKLRWAAGGAAVAGALFAAAGAALYVGYGMPARHATASPPATSSSAPQQNIPALLEPNYRQRAATEKAKVVRPAQRHARPSVRKGPSQSLASGSSTQLVVQRDSTPTSYSVSTPRQETPRQESTQPSVSSAEPAPLASPSGARIAAPAPLPPPR